MFKYILETLDIKLTFINNTVNNLIRYTNADFTEVINSCKLTNDYMFMLVREYISYQIKYSIVITLLSCKSEYMTMSKVNKEIMWMKWFLKKISY